MFAESETDLRDLIVQNLESCGFLNKIKAELRAGVFLALSEEGNLRKKIPVFNKKLDEFVETNDGKMAVSIIREFLEFYNLGFTLSVFNPEIASDNSCMTRPDLCKKLNLNESDCNGSILSALLKPKLHDLSSGKNETLKTVLKDITSMSDETAKNKSAEFQLVKHSTDPEVNKEKNLSDVAIKNNATSPISSQSLSKPNTDKDIFAYSKSAQKDIFKEQSSVIDPFFDEPVPSEKTSFLDLGSSFGDESKFPTNSNNSVLSSLKDLPALTKKTSLFDKDLGEPGGILSALKRDFAAKKDLDLESTEELSDRQINSEESIEEEIEEEDLSAGLEDLLNSSLSLGEDATSDQTVSQASVVEGVDHIESCNTVE